MRVWLKVVIISAILVTLGYTLSGCSNDDAGSNPEDVVRDFHKAMQAQDVEKMASYVTGATEYQISEMGRYVELADEIKISNMKTRTMSQTEDTAMVELECSVEVKSMGETISGDETSIIEMEKVDGKWLMKWDMGGMEEQESPNEFDVDWESVQLAAATYYSDVHAGWRDVNMNDNPEDASSFLDNVWGDSSGDTEAGHYYPTAISKMSNHILNPSDTQTDSETGNPLLVGTNGAATTDEIKSHAIWMGLLVNEAGEYTINGGSTDRANISPLDEERWPYMIESPKSCIAGGGFNGAPEPGGTYCWVVGKNGKVFGAYQADDGNWYSGFNGTYP